MGIRHRTRKGGTDRALPPVQAGIGFDMHRLAKGIPLYLGGVQVDFPMGLVGHSDGDVVLHAIADALLGGAGLGDIGTHFPDTDPKLKGIRSTVILKRVGELLREKGFEPSYVDAVAITQAPKLGELKRKMRDRIAGCLGISVQAVNMKGKSTNKVGIIGTGKAMAAMAVAIVRRAPINRRTNKRHTTGRRH
jgi:2-C-methyl-D-erythritol 2,4-cyclodiphosphate synthase